MATKGILISLEIIPIKKAKGMAGAKARAVAVFNSGGSISDCPYKSKAWRSCFAHEMQRLQQQVLM